MVSLCPQFGTAAVGVGLWNLRRSVLLPWTVRNLVSDYSLPLAVCLLSILGSAVFSPVKCQSLPLTVYVFPLHACMVCSLLCPPHSLFLCADPRFTSTTQRSDVTFEVADLGSLPVWTVFAAGGFGALVSFLIFMDNNITVALVQAPELKLKKGLPP